MTISTMLTVYPVLLLIFLDYCDAITGRLCKVPMGGAGTCVLLRNCEPLKNLYRKKNKSQEEHTFLTQSVGLCNGELHLEVCCPPEELWSSLVISPVAYAEPRIFQASGVRNTTTNVLIRDEDVGKGVPTSYQATFDLRDDNKQIAEYCGTDVSSSSRIVGGEATDIHEYPWLALLEYEPNEFKCGGSLISKTHVLTAAHCFTNGKPQHVILSEYNITTGPTDWVERNGRNESITATNVSVEWTKAHPQYTSQPNLQLNDIALIKMSRSVDFTEFIRPICLPTEDQIHFTSRTTFTVAGWGSDNKQRLTDVKRAVTVPYVSVQDCESPLMDKGRQYICAGGEKGKDSCNGDSGGPLMYEDKTSRKTRIIIVGVVSFGALYCGAEGQPGFYTNVYTHLKWIHDTMNETNRQVEEYASS